MKQVARVFIRLCYGIGLCFFLLESVHAQTCGRLKDASAESIVTFLKMATPDGSDPCIVFGILRLGEFRYKPAIGLLIDRLAVKRPGPVMIFGSAMRPRNLPYPAVESLIGYGDEAKPALLAALRDESKSPVVLINAAETLHLIDQTDQPELIRTIIAASAAHSDATRARALVDFAWSLAKRCPGQVHQQCYEALGGQRPPGASVEKRHR